ncbi:hypothetical protein V6N13_046388 [Hibiscus sabdariffa]|uniref:Uncharacterized protein n=1 Tax=Hibiscus sabdariffa TaxID=183260 RepID=A0ABR2DAD0_9ROSI
MKTIHASTAVKSSQGTNHTKIVDAASPKVVVSTPSDFTHPDAIEYVKENEGSKIVGTVVGLVAAESGDPVKRFNGLCDSVYSYSYLSKRSVILGLKGYFFSPILSLCNA